MRTPIPRSNRLPIAYSVILSLLPCGASTQNTLAAPPQQTALNPASAARIHQSATHDVIDEQTLRARATEANHREASRAAQTIPVTAAPPSTQSSLLTSSILISDGESFTILPLGSVLHLPVSLRPHIITRPTGDVLMWPDFLQKNPALITVKEVPLPMSRGEIKPTAAMLSEMSNESRIVVAVYRGCPITILEPARSDEPPTLKATNRR